MIEFVKNYLAELREYELYAVFELTRQEVCKRYHKDCKNCSLGSYACRHLYERR